MNFYEYFQNKNLKKTSKVGLHYEQKTTPDLLWCVAQAVLDITKDNRDKIFSDKKDVQKSTVFITLVQEYFSKPPPDSKRAKKEYDKLSKYQLGLFTYAGILKQESTRPSTYRIDNLEALEDIATNDLNAARFLGEYTIKFLRDNGLWDIFNAYKQDPNQTNHLKAKEAYWDWAVANTAIKGTNRDHTYRVFNKIFNVFCHKEKIPGEDASNITQGPCPYSFLIYNRDNFRDKDKPQGMTRREYREIALAEVDTEGVVETLLRKAKDAVKNKYDNDSEIKDVKWGYATERVVEVHHILPRHSYQQFSLSKENLILLTPDQHRSHAHNGSYKTVNPLFQAICLKTKLENISISIENGEDFYVLEEFISIVNTCFGWDLDTNTDVEVLRKEIEEKIQELS